jgi:chemotaxis protein CheD
MQTVSRPDDVLLAPGGFHFGSGDYRVRTLLGSCVAMTLWHPLARIGGMSHFLLPGRCRPASGAEHRLDGRFADESMAMFAEAVAESGTWMGDFEIKIFGGGQQFAASDPASGIDVPERNVAAAVELAARYGLSVTSTHLGQSGSRQVVLDLSSGAVWMRHRSLPSAGADR